MDCKIYCPSCEQICGKVYCGILYYLNSAVLDWKCPHCKADIKKEILKREDC